MDTSEALYKVQPNAPLGAPHWCNASCRGVASGAIQLVIATGRRLQSKMLVVDPPPGVDPDAPICRRGCFVAIAAFVADLYSAQARWISNLSRLGDRIE